MIADGGRGGTLQDRLAILQAISLATLAVLPGFLIGAMAPRIRAEFGFGPAGLGLAVAWFFIATGIAAPILGQVADRLDSRMALVIGALMTGVALTGIGMAPQYVWLLVALTVGGLANALSQPAVNASLSRSIPAGHLGLAIGIKQSAIPAATLLGGLAVPTLGVSLGWRGTFVVAGMVAVLGGVVLRLAGKPGEQRMRAPRRRLRESQPELRSLFILTLGGTFGAAAATSLGAFLVDAAVDGGIAEIRAGLIAASASAAGLLSRVGLGWWADRHPVSSRYRTISLALLLGSPGFLLLATGTSPAYVIGALLAYVLGWGWTGLFHYTVVSQNPTAPAASTGVIQTGLSLGAGLGPLVLGNVAERTSYPTAWVTASILSLVGALLFEIGRRHLRRARARGAQPTDPPRLPQEVHWGANRARLLAEGVSSSDHAGEGRAITLLQLAPCYSWRSRSGTDAIVLFVMQGEQADLAVGGVAHRQRAGDALTLPANVIWTARNGGGDDLVLALVRGEMVSTS